MEVLLILMFIISIVSFALLMARNEVQPNIINLLLIVAVLGSTMLFGVLIGLTSLQQ